MQDKKTLEFLQKLKDSGNWDDECDYSKLKYIGKTFRVEVIHKANNTSHLFLPHKLLEKDNQGWMFVWILSALLVQPFFKVALGKEIWNIIDVVWAVLLIISILKKNKLKDSK